MQNKWLFVLNPKSGGGKGLKVWPKIERALKARSISYECVQTKAKFHAAELVRKGIEKEFRKIISIGGDGTLHECLNGIYMQNSVEPQHVILGIYPVGTGNDWIKSHAIPKKFNDWLDYLQDEQTIMHDVGKVTYKKANDNKVRYFINIAGLGFEAAAVERACRKGNEILGGKLYYLLVVAKTLFSYKSQKMKIKIDDHTISGSKFCVTVGLNKFNGGGMQLLPHADATDGLFDVAVIDDISTIEVLKNLPKLYSGSIVNHPSVFSTQAKSIEINSDESVLLEADGEFLGSTAVQFEIIKHGVKILVL